MSIIDNMLVPQVKIIWTNRLNFLNRYREGQLTNTRQTCFKLGTSSPWIINCSTYLKLDRAYY